MAPLLLALLCVACSMAVEWGHGLRCAPPSPVFVCESIGASPSEKYLVLYGALTFDPADLPVRVPVGGDFGDAPLGTQFEAEFSSGRTVNTVDTNGAISYETDGTPVTVVVECLSEWCGALQAGEDYILYTEYDESHHSLKLTVDVCNTFAIDAPHRDALSAAAACAPRVQLSSWERDALQLRAASERRLGRPTDLTSPQTD
eukprot:Selendium_serpulae@DN3409_c0_g1_i3.p1